jgi:putative toxin-antitoxin system antitoxin component (TIGR02293 family)
MCRGVEVCFVALNVGGSGWGGRSNKRGSRSRRAWLVAARFESCERGSRSRAGMSRTSSADPSAPSCAKNDPAPLTVAKGDRVYRLAHVADCAAELIGDTERAIRWLKQSHHSLGGRNAISLLDTEIGTDLVIESLFAIASGGVASLLEWLDSGCPSTAVRFANLRSG